jgi:hypothetical protein
MSRAAAPALECHARHAGDLLSLLKILVEEGLSLPPALTVSIEGDDDTALALINRASGQLAARGCAVSRSDTTLLHRLTATCGSASYLVVHARRPGDRMEIPCTRI